MHIKKLNLLLVLIPFVLSGCLQIKTKPDISGGIYRSRDHGQMFEQISNIVSTGGGQNFTQDNVQFLTFDPTDVNTIYYSSQEKGLFVTHDSGTSWTNILANKGIIRKVLVDSNEPCHIYAQTSQNIFKSIDCGRRWDNIYLEKVKDRTIKDIVMDVSASNRLFMALSDGTIVLSEDYAVSWRVWHRFMNNGVVLYMWLNPKNTQIMYAATANNFYRSTNQGLDWENLGNVINDDFGFTKGNLVNKLVFLPEVDDGFYTVSTYGILKTLDGGQTWSELKLLPQPEKEVILSIAVNSANMNELYYGTARAVYYSKDGGVNWQTLASPSSRWNTGLLIHPSDPAVVYVAVYIPQQR